MTGMLEILDHTGDTKVEWNPTVQAEVEVAQDTFDKLKAKGYMAYKLDANGNTGEVLRSFDPNAARIVMNPQMQGG